MLEIHEYAAFFSRAPRGTKAKIILTQKMFLGDTRDVYKGNLNECSKNSTRFF
jgi:hypothetical protein